jgi:hypothetical protein
MMDENTTNAFRKAAETPEPVFPCHGCGGSYPLVAGTLVAHDLPGIGRCAGSGEVPRPVGVVPELFDNTPGPEDALERAARFRQPNAEMRELAGRMAADEVGEGNFGAAAELKAFAESPLEQRYPGLQDRLAAKFDDLAETGPLTPGQVPCRVCQLDDRTRAATDPNDLRCQECRDAGKQTTDKALKAFAAGPVIGTALESIPAAGEGLVMLGGQLEALTTVDSWRAAFAADLRRLLPQVTGAKLHAEHVVALADAFVDAGWVPGARRRAAEQVPVRLGENVGGPRSMSDWLQGTDPSQIKIISEDDRYEEQPIEDADGAVIGHVWELQSRHCLEHEREWVAAVDDNEQNRPRFGSRDGAEAWVRANALRDGRPLTVPYDAEKVLGLKSEVIGWVWLDPEHAGGDGRWLAVHGSAPKHQHPLFGGKPGSLDARNQAISWVLEQDKEARRGE